MPRHQTEIVLASGLLALAVACGAGDEGPVSSSEQVVASRTGAAMIEYRGEGAACRGAESVTIDYVWDIGDKRSEVSVEGTPVVVWRDGIVAYRADMLPGMAPSEVWYSVDQSADDPIHRFFDRAVTVPFPLSLLEAPHDPLAETVLAFSDDDARELLGASDAPDFEWSATGGRVDYLRFGPAQAGGDEPTSYVVERKNSGGWQADVEASEATSAGSMEASEAIFGSVYWSSACEDAGAPSAPIALERRQCVERLAAGLSLAEWVQQRPEDEWFLPRECNFTDLDGN